MTPRDEQRDRFEREGLERLERGEPLGEGFEEARAPYDRLKQAIGRARRQEDDMDTLWKRRVFEQIDRETVRRRHRTFASLAAAAAVVAALYVTLQPTGPVGEPYLRASASAGDGSPRRGEALHPGSRLALDAGVGDAAHAELRVYRYDGELVLRCSTEPPCRRDGEKLGATLVLDRIGEYNSLLLLSDGPIPEPSGSLDADVGVAIEAGAKVENGEPVQVQ